MKKIYKYELNLTDGITEIYMPEPGKILHSDFQGLGLFIWALIDTDKPDTLRKFMVVGTGHLIEIPDEKLQHISTYQNGLYVFHTFEILP